jgi:transposase
MNIFLHKFAIKMANRAVVMVMDGAAWHKSKSLERYKNIKIIMQPPHSPELNPVEKLWQYMKDKTIKNRIYLDFQELEKSIDVFFNSISSNVIKSVCSVGYV